MAGSSGLTVPPRDGVGTVEVERDHGVYDLTPEEEPESQRRVPVPRSP